MVLFSITYLRLNIFITWWMNIFQSTVVLRHIFVCSPSHTGPYPLLREHRTFHRRYSPFDLVFDPCKLHAGAYPPFLGSSDLLEASLSFDLVVDPHELSYWGISPLTKCACIIIWVILWLWATWSSHSSYFQFSQSLGSHLYQSAMFIVLSVSVWVRAAPILISHSSSCQFQFESGSHLYQSTIFLSFPRQFEFFRTAPISISHCHVSSVSSWDRTYIDRSLSCQFESRPHPYRSAIFLSFACSFWVGTIPISIGHSSFCLFKFESVPHLYRSIIFMSVSFSLSKDRTYIDRPSSYHFHVSLVSRTAPISIGHHLIS